MSHARYRDPFEVHPVRPYTATLGAHPFHPPGREKVWAGPVPVWPAQSAHLTRPRPST